MKYLLNRFKYVFYVLLFLTPIFTMPASAQLVAYESSIKGLYHHSVSARAEAMGQAGVASGGFIQEIHLNPAGLGLMKQKLQTVGTYQKHVTDEAGSHISFIGAGYRINDKLVLGLSRLVFFSKFPDLIPSTPTEGDAIDVRESYLTATGAYQVKEGIYAGANIIYFDHLYGDKRHFRSPVFGVGFMYDKPEDWIKHPSFTNQRFKAGVSLDNASFIDVKWKFDNSANIFPMPSQLRVGGAYSASLPAPWLSFSEPVAGRENSKLLDLLFQVQYLNFLNKGSEHSYGKWGFNIGTEVWFAKLLAIRLGYLYEKREGDTKRFNESFVLSLPYRKGLTAGLGLNIPVQQFSKGKLPFDVAFDFIHRQAYKHIKSNPVRKDLPFTNINLRLDWKL